MSVRATLVGACACFLGASACATSSAPREPEPVRDVEPQASTVAAVEPVPSPTRPAEPSTSERAEVPASAGPPASAEPPAAAVTGIAVCDEYLALYGRCEDHLRPAIMAGDRRFHRAEQAWLVHLAGTPEAASLPEACHGMLAALRVDCPEQHRRSTAPPASPRGGPSP